VISPEPACSVQFFEIRTSKKDKDNVVAAGVGKVNEHQATFQYFFAGCLGMSGGERPSVS